MKCVPKTNCDLKGVMTETTQNYSPEVELRRVPLIPCVNREAGNVVDVCCRDPNYKDPWPGGMMMMNGGGAGGGQNSVKVGQVQPAGARPQKQGQKKTQGKKRPNNFKKQQGGQGGSAGNKKKGAGGHSSSSGQGACSSNADCPAGTPVCSEYGYCQCAAYVPGGPECWQMSANW